MPMKCCEFICWSHQLVHFVSFQYRTVHWICPVWTVLFIWPVPYLWHSCWVNARKLCAYLSDNKACLSLRESLGFWGINGIFHYARTTELKSTMNKKLPASAALLECSVKYPSGIKWGKGSFFLETGCICAGSDSSLVVGGRLYVQYSTSEFYFWQRVNVGVFWEVPCCSGMLQNSMIIIKIPLTRQVSKARLVKASLVRSQSRVSDINLLR